MTFFENHHLDPHPLRLQNGVDYAAEEQADQLLAHSRKGVTALSEKRDWLSRDQLALVANKEVLNTHGVADESLYPGLFRRAFNPLAGHRPVKLRTSDDYYA